VGRYALLFPQPCTGWFHRGRHVRNGRRVIFAVDEGRAIGATCAKSRPRADPFDLAFDLARELRGPVQSKQLELDAGRARVDDKNAVHRSHAAGNGEALRRASA
jgi:hypothetical protein